MTKLTNDIVPVMSANIHWCSATNTTPAIAHGQGLPDVAVGALFASYAAAFIVATPLVGAWIDRVGIRTPMLAGIVVSIPFWNQSLWHGPVVDALPQLGDLSFIVGFVVAAGVYFALARKSVAEAISLL